LSNPTADAVAASLQHHLPCRRCCVRSRTHARTHPPPPSPHPLSPIPPTRTVSFLSPCRMDTKSRAKRQPHAPGHTIIRMGQARARICTRRVASAPHACTSRPNPLRSVLQLEASVVVAAVTAVTIMSRLARGGVVEGNKVEGAEGCKPPHQRRRRACGALSSRLPPGRVGHVKV